jgi:hypothetical protein
MTVKELKDFLEDCDDDMKVLCAALKEGYLDEVDADCEIRESNGQKYVYIDDHSIFI